MRTRLASVALALLLVSAAPAAHAEEASIDDVVDLTFPVVGDTTYTDDYDAPRGGGERLHRATDIMADHGTPVHAAVGGEVTFVTGTGEGSGSAGDLDDPPHYGYMLRVAGDDGRDYVYVHLGRQDGPAYGDPDVAAYTDDVHLGARVERGQRIGYVGSSGNAHEDAPHLHFEIHGDDVDDPYVDGGVTARMNPYPSLQAAEDRGDYPRVRDPDPDECRPVDVVDRVAGDDRVDTALRVAELHPDPRAVVLARADDHADALAGGPLASHRGGVVLLTHGDELDPRVADWIGGHDVDDVTLLGGHAALSDDVEDSVADEIGQTPSRLAGDDRYETAALVAEEVGDWDEALVALADHPDPTRSWPDAVTASTLAAHLDVPVVGVAPDRVPHATDELLRRRDVEVTVVGGTAAVPEDVADALPGEVSRRLDGEDRYETSVQVADATADGADVTEVWAATGGAFPDALAAAPVAAEAGAVTVLTDPGELPSSVREWYADRTLPVTVLGGEAAVSGDVAAAFAAYRMPVCRH